ncbi:hypothetical protein BHM03_00038579 [Ensete ventricosum]|nr:hypothetical protein BHM03_00038579 [Ensete ventricosum]
MPPASRGGSAAGWPNRVARGDAVKLRGSRGGHRRVPSQEVGLLTAASPQSGLGGRLGLRARLLGELWNVGDDCLKHSGYGLDLVGANIVLECGEVDSRLRKGELEAGVEGPPRWSVASRKGRLPRRRRALSVPATSDPSSSAKMMLDDSSGSGNQLDVVWPARGDQLSGTSRRPGNFYLVPWSDSCKERPPSGGSLPKRSLQRLS